MKPEDIQVLLASRGLPVEIREGTEELVFDTKALFQSPVQQKEEQTKKEPKPASQTIKLRLNVGDSPEIRAFLDTFSADAMKGEPILNVTPLVRAGAYEIEWNITAGRSLQALFDALRISQTVHRRIEIYVDYVQFRDRLNTLNLRAGHYIKIKDPLAPEIEPEEAEAEEDGGEFEEESWEGSQEDVLGDEVEAVKEAEAAETQDIRIGKLQPQQHTVSALHRSKLDGSEQWLPGDNILRLIQAHIAQRNSQIGIIVIYETSRRY